MINSNYKRLAARATSLSAGSYRFAGRQQVAARRFVAAAAEGRPWRCWNMEGELRGQQIEFAPPCGWRRAPVCGRSSPVAPLNSLAAHGITCASGPPARPAANLWACRSLGRQMAAMNSQLGASRGGGASLWRAQAKQRRCLGRPRRCACARPSTLTFGAAGHSQWSPAAVEWVALPAGREGRMRAGGSGKSCPVGRIGHRSPPAARFSSPVLLGGGTLALGRAPPRQTNRQTN